MAELPEDVRSSLVRAFAGETSFEATRLVESLDLSVRVLRAVVFLAAGDYEALERFARAAERDWRDVVFWAEYEDHDVAHPRKVRSMEEPLEE
jgi:hypothetical protein